MHIVVTMAGLGKRFSDAGYSLPKYMIEAKGKTLFYYSVNSLPFEIAKSVIFIILQEHQEKYDANEFIKRECKTLGIPENKIIIHSIPQLTRGQSETALLAKQFISDDEEILIYNIDTAFVSVNLKNNLLNADKKLDGLFGVFKLDNQDDKWSFAKIDDNGIIIETAEKVRISNYASTGLYHFTKAGDFFRVCENRIKKGLIEAKEFYIAPLYNDLIKEGKKFKLDIVNKFIPLGIPKDVENFIATKDVMGRYFNNFEISDGKITKTSSNVKKLTNEIKWFLNIPNELKKYAPKIHSYSLRDDAFIEMEYINSCNLSEIFIKNQLTTDILSNLLNIAEKFHSFKTELSESSFADIYQTKLYQRLAELQEGNEFFKILLNKDRIKINGRECFNIGHFEKEITNEVRDLYNKSDCGIIHGDYFFANILWNGGDMKLIDPRGQWGEPSIYGDKKYDIAKLSHSINGKYDFIVNDMFNVEYDENHIDFEIIGCEKDFGKDFEKLIKTKYDPKQIRFIESLLFLSMLPLHADNFRRQLVQYATGLSLLNSIFTS